MQASNLAQAPTLRDKLKKLGECLILDAHRGWQGAGCGRVGEPFARPA
jgi:hypothetical protein